MPFIALHKETKERLDITQFVNPRLEIGKGTAICQLCGESLFIKQGLLVSAHFCHYANCASDYIRKAESEEHRLGKRAVFDWLNENKENDDIQVLMEAPIPEIKRIADVLVIYPTGWKFAHEVQLSKITIEEFQERTRDYARVGIDVIWWIGEKNATLETVRWHLQNRNEYYVLQIERCEETIDLW